MAITKTASQGSVLTGPLTPHPAPVMNHRYVIAALYGPSLFVPWKSSCGPIGQCFIRLIRCLTCFLYESYVLVRRVTRITRCSAQRLKVALIIKLRHGVCGRMQPSDFRRLRGQLSIHLIGLVEHPRFPWVLAPRNAVDRL
jgi:hypothetical protein